MTANRPFVLCLTGSLAMGKSTAAKFFAECGVPVHDSDAAVHALYEGEAATLIEEAFPGSTSGGKVDRNKLAAMVVNGQAVAWWSTSVDIPLLFETEAQSQCDAVVVVSAPAADQRRRALDRPGMSEEKFAALLEKQLPDAEKRRRADFVVDSSGGFDHTRAQIRDILRDVATMRRR